MRFSLGFLLTLLVFSAVGCAALVNATEVWAQVCFTLTVAAILLAINVGLFGRGDHRVFGGGFAICSLTYFLLINSPMTQQLKPLLLTTRALQAFERQLPKQEVVRADEFPMELPIAIRWRPGQGNQNFLSFPPGRHRSPVHYNHIGHCLWAVMLGLAGGLAAQSIAARPNAAKRDEKHETAAG